MRRLITTTATKWAAGIPRLCYDLDTEALSELADSYIGKNIIITDRQDWDDEAIISAYRGQFIIEDVFKQMKDRQTGRWWPLHHWTDSKIRVHGLYCTIALLLRALAFRRVRQAGMALSMSRFLSVLDDIREVVNIHPKKRGQKRTRAQIVLTQTSDLRDRIIEIPALKKGDNTILGLGGPGSNPLDIQMKNTRLFITGKLGLAKIRKIESASDLYGELIAAQERSTKEIRLARLRAMSADDLLTGKATLLYKKLGEWLDADSRRVLYRVVNVAGDDMKRWFEEECTRKSGSTNLGLKRIEGNRKAPRMNCAVFDDREVFLMAYPLGGPFEATKAVHIGDPVVASYMAAYLDQIFKVAAGCSGR
ncbi:hypothetical protein ACFL2Q_04705 [Thermodesulfobacteriota bacterium]